MKGHEMLENIKDKKYGLTSDEAAERLRQFGSNIITRESRGGLIMFLRRFWGIVPWMLELAIILDIALKRYVEAGIITAWLVFSALLGFYQENRASQALALLRQRLIINARVKRDGAWQTIAASEIVPDDIVYLRVGDIVPADIQLIDGQIEVNQAQLTGESLPIEKTVDSTAYAGSLVTRGEATGIVIATGSRTYFGKTAELVKTAKVPARLEILITSVAKYLASFDAILALAVLVTAIARGLPLTGFLPFVLLLLVASVPVAAPMMFTMAASIGSRMLAKGGVLVTRLSAIEDAATMDVLCLDKTGTLTKNILTVAKVYAFDQQNEDDVLSMAVLASDEATQDPIDIAVINEAKAKKLIDNKESRLTFVPFDPDKKYSMALIRKNDKTIRIIKGEPLTISKLTKTTPAGLDEIIAGLTAEGNRVIAIASGTKEDMLFTGLIALSDPIRDDSAKLIGDLKGKGVRVLLVTGDNEATARTVASKVGLTGKVAPHGTIREGINADMIKEYEVFAGVLPEDKFYLVQALQKAGHVVGMTGDGVNDAPALKQADVGIAVANSTDVAKAAASLVLTQHGLDGIIKVIDGSRRIYQRMQSWLLAMITRKLSIPPFLSVGVLFFNIFALSPMLMVLFMFAGDVATFALSKDKVVPSPKPDRWVIRTLAKTGFSFAMLLFLLSILVLWSAQNMLKLGTPETQTLIFVWLVFSGGQAALYSTRARGYFWAKPYPGKWLIISTIIVLTLTVIAALRGWLMSPIPVSFIAYMLALSFVFLIGSDMLKKTLMKSAFMNKFADN